MEFIRQKKQKTLNVRKMRKLDEKKFGEKRFHLSKLHFYRIGKAQNMPVVASRLVRFPVELDQPQIRDRIATIAKNLVPLHFQSNQLIEANSPRLSKQIIPIKIDRHRISQIQCRIRLKINGFKQCNNYLAIQILFCRQRFGTLLSPMVRFFPSFLLLGQFSAFLLINRLFVFNNYFKY